VGVKETSNLGCLIPPHHSDFVVVLCNNIMRKTLATLFITSVALLTVQTPAHAKVCGGASFYGLGDSYAWRTTASGAPMDPNALTTAHRSLPFGTKLLVTNQHNGKSVVVRVTDRGPFIGGRVLDLSPRAFGSIASLSSGVTSVCYSRI
jgi:rare lipoprotein A